MSAFRVRQRAAESFLLESTYFDVVMSASLALAERFGPLEVVDAGDEVVAVVEWGDVPSRGPVWRATE